MKHINLIFGCHSHQPVGNFEDVFEMAYEKAYRPFMDVLERYPAVRVTQHYTGPLFDWFEANRPEFLERLAAAVRSGQVEIMGGGYYEPLLCAVPERDAIAQIERMNAFCVAHFGAAPKGMWLAERVWEPHMPRTLKAAGVEYTAVDDSHFLCSGLTPDEMFGYYVTEDEGQAVNVFPILERLRYLIPFHQVKESIAFLEELATEDGRRCAVIHDDGEKFGVWPETHRSVYEEGWLEEFFEALSENREWLHCLTYSQYMAKVPAIGRVYLPTASYKEMMEWALPAPMHKRLKRILKEAGQDESRAAEYKLFLRGSFWRNFLAKYPEANNVQKRMLRTSARLERLSRRKSPALEEARRLLHQGQCNCAYWHGVFGGLYLNHLRTALYEKLIAADALLDRIEHKNENWVVCETLDFDADGHDEAILENSRLMLAFSARDGGTLFEWDYKPKPFNFGNTLSRREEEYHELLRSGRVQVGEEGKGDHSIHELVRAKEAGLDEYLVYDAYRRVSLRDHFLPENIDARALWKGAYDEWGDFATGAYRLETAKDAVTLVRDGVVRANGEFPITVRKTVKLRPRASEFEIRYDLVQTGREDLAVCFGIEWAVNLLSGSAFDRYYRSDDRDLKYAKLGEMGRDDGLRHIAMRDDWQRLECAWRFDRPANVFRFAIETVSQSENGQERVYQGSVVVPCWPLVMRPGERVSIELVAAVLQME